MGRNFYRQPGNLYETELLDIILKHGEKSREGQAAKALLKTECLLKEDDIQDEIDRLLELRDETRRADNEEFHRACAQEGIL